MNLITLKIKGNSHAQRLCLNNQAHWNKALLKCHSIVNRMFPNIPAKECNNILQPITIKEFKKRFSVKIALYGAPELEGRSAALFNSQDMKIYFPSDNPADANAEDCLFHEYLHWRSARNMRDIGISKWTQHYLDDNREVWMPNGLRLNEGATEYLNEKIRIACGIKDGRVAYPREVGFIKYLIEKGAISEADFLKAYFEKGYDHFARMIDEKLGYSAADAITLGIENGTSLIKLQNLL